MRFRYCLCLAAALMLIPVVTPLAQPQDGDPSAPQITTVTDDSLRVTLRGNTRPEATAANDRGGVADGFKLDHLQLLLSRPARQEAALEDLIDAMHDRHSPSFHHWLTARAFGERFGVAQQDLDAISAWLASHGFHVNGVSRSRMIVDFSGTAGDVRDAFHTEIHALEVDGVRHVANLSDPQIPASLAPAVAGIVSLHDFRPRANIEPRADYTFGTRQCYPLNAGGGPNGPCYAVVPADLATIYNFKAAFAAGITGAGQTIVLIEDSDVYDPADWTVFRSTFGLSGYTSGSFAQIHPAGSLSCADPGVKADEGDATLDAQWSSAAAPDAAIVIASCANTQTTWGGLVALENVVNGTGLPASISLSYAECEAFNGAAANAAYNAIYQQAAAEGVSVFASAGDWGAAVCDTNQKNATHGIGVSGLASSPYDVAVGGTDFGDAYGHLQNTYWNSSNDSGYGSVKSYVPEIPWNDSCASVLIATYYSGSGITYGANGYCNAGNLHTKFISTAAGSGGPSGCATGTPAVPGVVGGTCAGWQKPSWQRGFAGIVNDKVRDMPDVALFAGNGIWSHYYLYCDSNGGGCSGAPSHWYGAGGTSFSTPIMAGVQALIDQKTGQREGNPNPTLYALARKEYGKSGNANCLSALGNKVSSSCIFYDVRRGDMDVNCTGPYDCYLPSGQYGVLSTSPRHYELAYRGRTGWDFATGVGTINVANLIDAWP